MSVFKAARRTVWKATACRVLWSIGLCTFFWFYFQQEINQPAPEISPDSLSRFVISGLVLALWLLWNGVVIHSIFKGELDIACGPNWISLPMFGRLEYSEIESITTQGFAPLPAIQITLKKASALGGKSTIVTPTDYTEAEDLFAQIMRVIPNLYTNEHPE